MIITTQKERKPAMINILLSVKQPFSGLIMDGQKIWELRKNAPRVSKGEGVTLWLYESGQYGARGVIGKCRLVVTGSLRSYPSKGILELAIKNACVTEEHLLNYLPCFVWGVQDPMRISTVPLSEINLTRPPQSWQYLTPEQAAILEQAAYRECVPTAKRDCPNCKYHDLLTKQYPCRECYPHEDQRLWEPRKEDE